jgi:hypothetical protein
MKFTLTLDLEGGGLNAWDDIRAALTLLIETSRPADPPKAWDHGHVLVPGEEAKGYWLIVP